MQQINAAIKANGGHVTDAEYVYLHAYHNATAKQSAAIDAAVKSNNLGPLHRLTSDAKHVEGGVNHAWDTALRDARTIAHGANFAWNAGMGKAQSARDWAGAWHLIAPP